MKRKCLPIEQKEYNVRINIHYVLYVRDKLQKRREIKVIFDPL